MEDQGTDVKPDLQKKFKRKSGQNSRFLKKAKKFGSQGKLGRGYEIDSDTYNYFLRVLELHAKNEFDDDDERGAFMRNSLEQTKSNEVNLTKNQMVSRVLEKILPSADDEALLCFCEALTPSLRILCCDPFASHVVEKLLQIISTSRDNAQLIEWFQSTSKFILNNYEEFVFDIYANAVMRKVFACLTGTVEPLQINTGSGKNKSGKLMPNKDTDVKPPKQWPEEYITIFKDFALRFVNWHQYNDLLVKTHTSGLVQTFLQALPSVDSDLAYQAMVQTLKLIPPDFPWDAMSLLFILETCIQLANETLYEFIYGKYFKLKVKESVLHNRGQHTIRKLITYCPTKELYEEIFDDVVKEFEGILKAGYTNVLVACGETCKRLTTKQSAFVKAIKSLFSDDGSDDSFLEQLVKSRVKVEEDKTRACVLLDLNGCLIIQHMLEFHKPHKVVKSLLEMELRKLIQLVTNPKGSHIFDSYFRSSTVGDKNKEKLLMKLKEDAVELTCSKFGSRVLDAIWDWSSIQQKAVIAGALSSKSKKVSANEFGKFLAEKICLRVFKHDAKKWEEHMSVAGKRKREVHEITDTLIPEDVDSSLTESNVRRKKKKKKHDNE